MKNPVQIFIKLVLHSLLSFINWLKSWMMPDTGAASGSLSIAKSRVSGTPALVNGVLFPKKAMIFLFAHWRNALSQPDQWGARVGAFAGIVFMVAILTTQSAQAQTLELEATTNKTDILSGESYMYTFKYKCASTTTNCTGVVLTASIPANAFFPTQSIGLPSDIQSYVISPDLKTVTFTFEEPLTAGNTGIIEVMAVGGYGVANNSVATLTAELTSGGNPGNPQVVTTTIHSYDKFCPVKRNGIGLGVDNQTTYFIGLGASTSNGYTTTGIGLLSPGPITVVDQLPAGTIIESVSVIPRDGNPLPVIPPGACQVDAGNSTVTCTFPASVMQVSSAYQPSVDIKITVTYPSPTFSAGDNVTNRVTVTYQPEGVASPITLTNGDTKTFMDGTTYATLTSNGSCTSQLNVTDVLAAPLSQLKSRKNGPATIKPGESMYYEIDAINTGNIILTDVVMEDIIPAGITISSISPGYLNGFVGDEVVNRYVKTANNPTYTLIPYQTYVVPPGDVLTAFKMTFDKIPPGAYTEYVRLNGTSTAGVSGTSIVNCITTTASNPNLVKDVTSTDCHTLVISQLDQFSTLGIRKYLTMSVNNEYNLFYGGPITRGTSFWSFIILSNFGGGQPLQNPVAMDLLPIGLDYDNTIVYNGTTPTADVVDIIPNFNGTGRTLVRLKWNSPMPSGIEYGFSVAVKVNEFAPAGLAGQYSSTDLYYNPYLAVGGIKNTAFFTGTSPQKCAIPLYSPASDVEALDIFDLNSNGVTSETLCYGSAYVGITSSAQLSSVKWVKGQCDTDYSRFPDFGQTVPGGIANYKLIVTNTGNVATNSIELLDILPWVGDKGVIDPTGRLTEWRPNLVTPIQTPAGVTVYYSTATNPCRTDYVAAGPAGCTPANWSTVLPQDPTTIQALKLDFGSKVLQPGDQIELTWDMRAPVTAPTNNEIAWNSFGYKAKRNDNNDPFLPSEPFKVGIKVKADVKSSYGNFVWLDTNKNGIQDAGETGIDGVRVELHKDNGDNVNDPKSDPLVAFTSTANGGLYLFPGLDPGNYYAVFFLPPGYDHSPANTTTDELDSDGIAGICNGNRVTIVPITNLTAGEADITWDQGIFPAKAAVGNYVWYDENQNNIQDESSANGINGVIVCLYTSTGVFSASTTTTNDVYGRPGYYLFDQLDAGSYYVQFKPTPDKTYTPGSGSQGGTTSDENDSDVDPATGKTAIFTLAAGQIDLTWDAGLIIQTGLYKLGNYVWSDTNNDGKVDGTETGINGVTVNLYNDRNNDGKPQADESVTTTITGTVAGTNGIYVFDRLPAGNYIVQIPDNNFKGVLLDYISSTGNDPAPDPDDNIENDDNGSAVVDCGIISQPITLTNAAEPLDGGYTNFTVDFGFYKCNKPDYLASVVQPTCAGDKGSILISGGTIGDKVGYSIGTAFTGTYATAVAISSLTGGVVVGNISGSASDVTYTVRVFNGEEACYNDFTFTILKLTCCVTPTNVVATATPASVTPGANVTLTATATDATAGETTYTWSGSGISTPVATTVADATVAAPATEGIYTYTVLVSNGTGCTATAQTSLTVLAPVCSLSAVVTPTDCNSLTNEYTVTGIISLTNNTTDGTATITDGVLSTTVSVPASATSVVFSLSGLPSGTGSHTVTVSLPSCGTATATYSAPASCTVCTVALTTNSLPNGQVDTPYSQTITATGGTLPYTYTVLGSLPAGLSLETTTGVISGTPTTASATSLSVVVTDTKSCSDVAALSITVASLPVCSLEATATPGDCNTATNQYTLTGTISATNAAINSASPQTLTVSVGNSSTVVTLTGDGPVSYTLTGLTSDGLDKTLSVVSSATACGTISVTYTAPASCSIAPPALSVLVSTPLCNSVTNTYTATGSVSLSNIVSGSLTITDNGTTLEVITLTPGQTTASFSVTGISNASSHTVVATLTDGTSASVTYAAPVACTVCSTSLITASLPNGQVDTPYSQTLITTGGTLPYTYTVLGTLPAGLSLETTTGVISGTPTSATTTSFSVVVTDTKSCSDVAALSITVASLPVCSLEATATPGVCNTATNTYTVTGTVSATNAAINSASPQTLTISVGSSSTVVTLTDNGPVSYTLIGLTSDGLDKTLSVISSATACGTASVTFTAPASCSIAPPALSVLVSTPVCNSVTNTYTATGSVSLSNIVSGSLTITDNGTTLEVITLTPGQTTASFSVTGISNASSHTVVATLTDGTSASVTYAAPVACTVCSTSLITASLPNGQVDTPYSQTLITTGGTLPYTYTVLGTLPAGLSLETTTGVISGTPTSATTTSFSVVVTDTKSCSDVAALSITVASLPVCSLEATATPGVCNTATNTYTVTGTVSATNAAINSASPQTLTVSVGSSSTVVTLTGDGPVSFTLTGLTSDGLDKTLSVVSGATACGTASVTFTAPASCSIAPPALSVLVSTPLCNSVTNTYTATATVSLSNIVSGSLTITDNGTSLTTITLTVGQTTASFSVSGLSDASSHTLVAALTDGTSASAIYSAPVACTVCSTSLTTASLPNGQVDTPYSQTITATGGTLPYTYAVLGTLPAGLSLEATTGVISGTPTSATTTSFSVVVTDAKACSDVAALSITVASLPVCSLEATATPGVCNTATNTYTVTGTVSATNTPANQSLTLSVGSSSTVVTLTGDGPVSYTLTGLPSDGLTQTVSVVSSATACGTASVTFTAPASCSIAPPALSVLVSTPLCNSVTNTYTATGSVSLSNIVSGSLTITDNGTTLEVITLTPGQTTASFSVSGVSDASSHTLVATLTDGTSASATYAAPQSCSVTPCQPPIHVCKGTVYAILLEAPADQTTYQWYRNGAPISGATFNSYTATQAGSYSVVVNGNVVGQCPNGTCCPILIVEDSIVTYQAQAQAPTCNSATNPSANADGRILITNWMLSDSDTTTYFYQVSLGSSFDAAQLVAGSATTLVPANGLLVGNLANPASTTGQAYTVRLSNGLGCTRDVVVTLMQTNCSCPPAKCLPMVIRKTR